MTTQPDVFVLHLSHTPTAVRQVIAELASRSPATRVVVIPPCDDAASTAHVGPPHRPEADGTPAAIVSAIVGAVAGSGGAATDTVAGRPTALRPSAVPNALTARDQELLRLIGTGLNNTEIAAELHITEKTVRNEVSRLYNTIKVSNRPQAILFAIKAGLVAP